MKKKYLIHILFILITAILLAALSITGCSGERNQSPSANEIIAVKDGTLAHIKITYIPEADYSNTSPLEFLEMLKQHPDGIYTPMLEVPDGWIKYRHVKELAKYTDSDEPCARVVSGLSSYLPLEQSTVGNEAMFLMEGYLRGKYPPALHSEGFTDRDAQWYKTVWESYLKERINEHNTFIYLKSQSNSDIGINEVKKYSGTPTMIYTVYDQQELETVISLMENKACIWIDREAANTVDKDWLYKKAVEEKYPVILIGHGNALHSFRDLLSICRYMCGPKVPDEEIQKDGFAAYLLINMDKQENSLSVKSIFRGFPGALNVREIMSISNKLLTGGSGLMEKNDMSPEEQLRYSFWTMKSNPENEELIDKVRLSLKSINWSRLLNLDSNDVFLIMDWFAGRSLQGDRETLKVFLESRTGLDAAVAEGYFGYLAKILEENTEVFIKCFAALSDDDMDYICKYLQNELDERPVWEKRLMEVQQNYDFSEREKEALKKLLGMKQP